MIMEEEKTAKERALEAQRFLYKLLWFRNRPRRCGICMNERLGHGPEAILMCRRCDGSGVGVRLLLAPWCASPECGCVD